MFRKLTISGWRQFRLIDLNFHPRLTVLTGANGAGKSTLLNLVSRHFGWSSPYISTPKRKDNGGSILYSTDYWEDEVDNEPEDDRKPLMPLGPQILIGTLVYSNGVESPLYVPTDNAGTSYDVQLPSQQLVEGLHIPSHRAVYSYQPVQNIPTVARKRSDAFNQYVAIVRSRLSGNHTQWSPQYFMKETLISLATFGYGNSAVDADPDSAKIFEEFQDVLRKMLPPKLGFKRLVIRVPEVILDTATGQFSLDAVSGGAAAVIDLAWQVFMYQPTGSTFVVTLDEPENHLHPELQRRVLADLLAAFPSVQFVVATHSPFIVGSVSDSNVYVLNYDDTSKVNSALLDTMNKAGSANEILRDVLGLEFTMPIWVESKIDALVTKYSDRAFTNETLAELRQEMEVLGLSRHIPQTISMLAEIKSLS